jgi:tRNA threonylcarbamoyladenosine biosynthesis protein TsaB
MLLAIDTSGETLGLALLRDEDTRALFAIRRRDAHDSLLLPLLQQMMEAAGVAMDELTAVAVSAGPGSFTGLRIGMAAAKGIAIARDIPLLTVPPFDALAWSVAAQLPATVRATLCIAMDARREDVYTAMYALADRAAAPLQPLRALPLALLPADLPDGTLLLGDAAERVAALRPGLSVHAVVAPLALAEHVARRGAALLRDGQVADPAAAEPLYVREVYTSPPPIAGS